MQSWEKSRLGDISSKIGSGATPRGGSKSYKDSGTSLIRSLNVHDFRFERDSLAFIDHDQASALDNVRVLQNDVLLNITGASVARCCMVPSDILPARVNQHVSIIRCKSELADPQFVHYTLTSPIHKARLLSIAQGGATREALTKGDLEDFEIDLPDITTQQRISSTLSAYDDFIENNNRRIAILEDMARRIYEEWFVRFRFPGHKNVNMVESVLGMVPEGWDIETVGEILIHSIGGGWGEEKVDEKFDTAAFVIRGTDIPFVKHCSIGGAPLRYHKKSNFKSRRLEDGDVILEASGGSKDQPVGRSVLVRRELIESLHRPVIPASFCKLMRVNKQRILPELLQLHLERIYADRQILKYQSQSTGISNFKFTYFLEHERLLIPAAPIQEKFASLVRPILKLVGNLGLRRDILAETRNLLLPRLISGEIDVADFANPV